jgi:predicted transcriptional regulator
MATDTIGTTKRRRISDRKIKRIEELRKKNYSFYEIADKLGISMTAARYWYIKKHENEKFLKDKEARKECFTKWYKKNQLKK